MYNLEDAYPTTTAVVLEATACRWGQLEQQDHRLGNNSRWLPPRAPRTPSMSSSPSTDDGAEAARRRGRDYVEARAFTGHLAEEADRIYDFDCPPVPYFYPIPCRKGESPVPDASPCWGQEWSSWTGDGTSAGAFDVFLNLTVRDGSGRSWNGYRTVRSISPSEVEISLDIIPLVEELRWRELRQYHARLGELRRKGQHHGSDDRHSHHLAMRELESIMRRLQVTVTRAGAGDCDSDDRHHGNDGRSCHPRRGRLLLCATGGFHCMAAGNPLFDCSAYFHDRCPRRPLATVISGGPYTTCMTITADDRLVIKLARASIED